MNYLIRRAVHEDAPDIIESHVRSIRELCAKDYSLEQIEAWSGRNFKNHLMCQTIDRDYVWVIESNGKVKGFGHLALMSKELGEVMGLYFCPEVCGHGAGKRLLNSIKEVASSYGIKKLQLYATVTAKTFYEAQGFKEISGDHSVGIGGVQIPCFPMICDL